MTPALNPPAPTLERCRDAIAGVRERYSISISADEFGNHGVLDWRGGGSRFVGTRAECQSWIDEQAARACIGALLPVSDGVLADVADARPVGMASTVESALTAVLGEKA